MTTLIRDLRYAFRLLARNPGFSAVAVLTVALGIGANTAIFSVVNAVLLRPLPYRNPDRLVMIWVTEPSGPGDVFPATGPDFMDWRAQNHVFESIVAGSGAGATLTGATEPMKLRGITVYPGTFELLGVQPLRGRTFAPDEIQPGHDHVVILSYGLWERAFGLDPQIVGGKITLDGQAYDVAGVMPRWFEFPPVWGMRPDYYAPVNFQEPAWKKERGNHWLWVMARLKDGVSIEKAQAEMETLTGRLAQQYPVTNTGVIAKVRGLRDQLTLNVKPALLVLLAAVGFLLLIACVNVANLLLARAVGRQREIAIRLAVGSGRRQLVQQLLTESVVLFLAGGLAGLLLGGAALRLLLHAAPEGYIPAAIHVGLDAQVFGFAFLISLVTGALAGLVPALQSASPDLHRALKESGAAVASPHRRSRSLLTAGEIALALVMLISAGLAIRSLARLLGVNAGFDARGVLTARVSLPDSRDSKDSQVSSFYQQLQDRVSALPGVASVSATSELPFEGGQNGTIYVEGQPAPKNMWSSPLVEWCRVMPGYFGTMRIPLLRGRDFTRQDTTGQLKVVIINQAMANRFWPNQDAVGKRFTQDKDKPKWITVAGVVGDVREYGLDQPTAPEAYFPITQDSDTDLTLVIRSSIEPLSQTSAVRKVLGELDKDVPLYQPRPLAQLVRESSEQQRFVALLLALFAAVALVLASVGIYGVISHSVAQRTREIGVRMALGAERRDVLGMVLAEGLWLTSAGILAGLAAAWGLTRFLAALLYGIRPTDPATFAAVALLLAAVALAAVYIPARRATQVDPLTALRYE